MLTIFHSADWHLGQSLHGFDRDVEHSAFLDWLLDQLRAHRPNALLIAGDVFDSINPSAVSQKRYYRFLANAHAELPSLHIVITAGNHDAAARLEAPADVLVSLNVTVVGTVYRNDEGDIDLQRFLVPLHDEQGVIQGLVLAVPFLRPSDVPLVQNASDPYLDGIREFYRQLTEAAHAMKANQCPDAAMIAMGHCHLCGGDESRDSERRLVVGGAEAIGPETFDRDCAYVALGHLHKAQQFDGGRIRYCGSPIPLSFNEAHYRHRLLKITLDQSQLTAVEEIPIPQTVVMQTIPATGAAIIDDVLSHLEQLTSNASLPPERYSFLEVRVLEEGPDPMRRRRIEQALEGKPFRLASIKLDRDLKDRPAVESDPEFESADLKSISPEDIFLSAHLERYGIPASAEMIKAFREVLLQEVATS